MEKVIEKTKVSSQSTFYFSNVSENCFVTVFVTFAKKYKNWGYYLRDQIGVASQYEVLCVKWTNTNISHFICSVDALLWKEAREAT